MVSISQCVTTGMDTGSLATSQRNDRRIIQGWAALERGDVDAARAALQDVFSADPSHPALPLLAAGIRRARPRRVPWLQALVLLAAIGIAVVGVRYWMSQRPAARAAVNADQGEPATAPPASTDSTPPLPEAGSPANSATAPRAPSHTPRASPAVPDGGSPLTSDDVQIRQAIARFASAYSNRWGRLEFSACDISPAAETTVVTCRARPAQQDTAQDASGLWTFSCRKAGDVWRIISVQPPPGVDRSRDPRDTVDRDDQ